MQDIIKVLSFLATLSIFLFLFLAIISQIMGWKKLHHNYKINATTLSISEGSFRWVHCKKSSTSITVAVEIYAEGLWLRPGFPLWLMMPAVLIPWNSMEIQEVKSFLGIQTSITIKECGTITISGESGAVAAQKWRCMTGETTENAI